MTTVDLASEEKFEVLQGVVFQDEEYGTFHIEELEHGTCFALPPDFEFADGTTVRFIIPNPTPGFGSEDYWDAVMDVRPETIQ